MANISVILPIYNVEKYLKTCLDSIINQTFKELEIICIDDASPDNSRNILIEYANKDKRINLILNDENKGVAYSRNIGIERANGEYLSFIDPDDYISLNFYEELYKKIEEEKADIAKANIIEVRENSTIKRNSNEAITDAIKNNSFIGNTYTHGFVSSIYRTSMIKNKISFPMITNGEDLVFLLQAIIACKVFTTVDNVFYYYKIHYDSASYSIAPQNLFNILEHYRMRINILNSTDLPIEDYNKYFEITCNELVSYCINRIASNNKVLFNYIYDCLLCYKDLIFLNKYLPDNIKKDVYSFFTNPPTSYKELENFKIDFLSYIKQNKIRRKKIYLFSIIPIYMKKI